MVCLPINVCQLYDAVFLVQFIKQKKKSLEEVSPFLSTDKFTLYRRIIKMYNVFVQKRFKNRHDTELIAQGALNTQVQVKTCPSWRNIVPVTRIVWWKPGGLPVLLLLYMLFFPIIYFP